LLAVRLLRWARWWREAAGLGRVDPGGDWISACCRRHRRADVRRPGRMGAPRPVALGPRWLRPVRGSRATGNPSSAS